MVNCPRYYAFNNKVKVNYKQWIQQQMGFMSHVQIITRQESDSIIQSRIFKQNKC